MYTNNLEPHCLVRISSIAPAGKMLLAGFSESKEYEWRNEEKCIVNRFHEAKNYVKSRSLCISTWIYYLLPVSLCNKLNNVLLVLILAWLVLVSLDLYANSWFFSSSLTICGMSWQYTVLFVFTAVYVHILSMPVTLLVKMTLLLPLSCVPEMD